MVLLFGASFDWFDSFDELRINKLTTGKLRAGCVLCLPCDSSGVAQAKSEAASAK